MPDRDRPMTEDELCTLVGSMVKEAEDYRDERSSDRIKAMEYFDGDADDMQRHIPADEGKSRVVSRDVRSAIKKVLPSLIRTILGNDEIVEYTPVGEGDEEGADQATDYVNYIALPECDGRQAIEDAINDAIRLRNGIIKWWQEKKIDVKVSLHTGLDEDAFAVLVADDDVEVLEHTEGTETIEGPEGPIEVPSHDVKIRRRITTSMPKIAAIPLENFLIHPDATRLDESPVTGENCRLRRTDLVSMGYDRDVVFSLPTAEAASSEQENEEDTRRRDVFSQDDALSKAMQEVEYYDLLVRIDHDGDGIAELRRMVFAGGLKAKNLLENTEWDEINYADIVSERRPHQWEGNSVPDDVIDIQTVNTVLLRQTMDNLYWQNNLQPIVQEDAIVDRSAVTNPMFGKPIVVGSGIDVRSAVGYNIVPMVADKSFAMLSYMKEEMTDRTGISDASSGMAPDALQNMTAKASAMIEQAGIGQTEMMVRCIANSLKPVFRGLLKLIIQHQDKPRTVRLRDEWVTFDPRHWNAEMDATVNTGLGAGTRERDMMAMMQVIGLQEKILASLGPLGMQYVTPDNLYNSISKMVESAGLRSVGLYFTKPDPEAIQQALQSQSQKPSPEEIKAQAAMQLEQVRTDGKKEIEAFKVQAKQQEFGVKMQVEANKEREQRDADLTTNLAELERETENRRQEALIDMQKDDEANQIKRDEIAVNAQLTREEIASRERIAAHNAQANIQKAQAQSIGKAFEKNDKADK